MLMLGVYMLIAPFHRSGSIETDEQALDLAVLL